MCRWDEIGIVKEAAAVLGRSYACVENFGELCDMNFKSVVEVAGIEPASEAIFLPALHV